MNWGGSGLSWEEIRLFSLTFRPYPVSHETHLNALSHAFETFCHYGHQTLKDNWSPSWINKTLHNLPNLLKTSLSRLHAFPAYSGLPWLCRWGSWCLPPPRRCPPRRGSVWEARWPGGWRCGSWPGWCSPGTRTGRCRASGDMRWLISDKLQLLDRDNSEEGHKEMKSHIKFDTPDSNQKSVKCQSSTKLNPIQQELHLEPLKQPNRFLFPSRDQRLRIKRLDRGRTIKGNSNFPNEIFRDLKTFKDPTSRRYCCWKNLSELRGSFVVDLVTRFVCQHSYLDRVNPEDVVLREDLVYCPEPLVGGVGVAARGQEVSVSVSYPGDLIMVTINIMSSLMILVLL